MLIYDASASTHLREYEVVGLPSLVTSLQAVVMQHQPDAQTASAKRGSAGEDDRNVSRASGMKAFEEEDRAEELLVLGDYRGFVRILRFLQPHNALIPKGDTDAGQVHFIKWQDLTNHRDHLTVETMSSSHGGPVARAKYLREKGWLLSCSKDPHHPLILHHPVAMLPPHHFSGAPKVIVFFKELLSIMIWLQVFDLFRGFQHVTTATLVG